MLTKVGSFHHIIKYKNIADNIVNLRNKRTHFFSYNCIIKSVLITFLAYAILWYIVCLFHLEELLLSKLPLKRLKIQRDNTRKVLLHSFINSKMNRDP